MARIQVLSDDVIDKIAAGEVVESPAAVVKELVENALDAGASRISIEIKAGGFQLIRVDDDGVGMDEEDAILSLKRHATSKISSADDLFKLQTMGFRGEALASIAAVSKLTVITHQEGAEPLAIQAEGGKILKVEPYPHEKGTSVEVRSLFYNTPARRSFQKSTAASVAEIIRLVIALSLAHPDKHMELTSQDESVIRTLHSTEVEMERLLGLRVKSVLGETFFSQASYVCQQQGAYQVFGYLGQPHFVRQNRLGQYLFINGRWVQSPFISGVLREAYGTHIKEGSHPHFVLHFRLPEDHVDVNVHPQKKEVRLKEQIFLKELIAKVVGSALNHPVSENLSVSAPSFTQPSYSFREDNPWQKTAYSPNNMAQMPLWDVPAAPPKSLETIALFSPYLLAKGRLQEKEILLGEEGILLFDLKSVYARVLFEALSEKADGQKMESHQLLIPLTLRAGKEEVYRLEEATPLLKEIGLEVRAMGEETLAIDAYPSVLREKDARDFLLEMLSGQPKELLEGRHRRFAIFSSRFARSRKEPFLREEAKALVESLQKTSRPFLCPLGKTTVQSLGEQEFEKLFLMKGGK